MSSFNYESKITLKRIEYFLLRNITLIPDNFINSIPLHVFEEHYGKFEDKEPSHLGATHFMRISLPVLLDQKLKSNDKLVFGFIETLLEFYEYAYASINYMAKMLGLDPKTVRGCISRLKSRGLIYSLDVNQKIRIYLIGDMDEIYPEIIEDYNPRGTSWGVYAQMRDDLKTYYDSVCQVKYTFSQGKKQTSEVEKITPAKEEEVPTIENNSKRKSDEEKVNRNSCSSTSLEEQTPQKFGIYSPENKKQKEEKISSPLTQGQ